MFRGYMRLLNTRPYLTKATTAGGVMFLGDSIQQGIEHRARAKQWRAAPQQQPHHNLASVPSVTPKQSLTVKATVEPEPRFSLDVVRAGRMAAFGVCFLGPVMHNWFNFLERILPGATAGPVFKKMLVDQAVMSPAFTAIFFTALGAMEGRSFGEIKQTLTEKFWPTLITNYYVWPAGQILNFYVVPVQLRVLWLNGVGLGFNIYLSKMLNDDKIKEKEKELHKEKLKQKDSKSDSENDRTIIASEGKATPN